MKTKIAALALIAVTAGVFTYNRTQRTLPSDLRDAVADATESKDFNTRIPDLKSENGDKAKLELPKAKAGNRESGWVVLSCTTPGDALSEVQVANVLNLIIITYMDGKNVSYTVDDWMTHSKTVDVITGRRYNSNDFGGASDNSVMFAYTPVEGDNIVNARLAANGYIYNLRCKAKKNAGE